MTLLFEAWVQVSHGDAHVALVFRGPFGIQHTGWAIARSGCWSMLKGGLILTTSAHVDLYLEVSYFTLYIYTDCIKKLTKIINDS